MERTFWETMWAEEVTPGFHQADVNRHLVAHLPRLAGEGRGRVLVPLCGKSRDLAWLAERFDHVVGVELVDSAVRAWFEEHGVPYERREEGEVVRYASEGVTLLCADFLRVGREHVGEVDRVYDRAALVALPPDMRRAYADRLIALTEPGARMLLITYVYDQGRVDGTTFSVPDAEVHALYGEAFHIERLTVDEPSGMPPRFDGIPVTQPVWLLTRR